MLYTPLLMLFIFVTVQFALVWLGNSTADAVARQTARVVRATQDPALGHAKGVEYADNISRGTLNGYHIRIDMGGGQVRVTVTGHAQELIRFGGLDLVPEVSQTVTGPLEQIEPAP